MIHTFHTNRRFRARIESALDELTRELDTGQLASVDPRVLRPVAAPARRPGSKPLVLLADPEGRPFVFKESMEPALAAAEEAAHELRRLGGRPGVPARRWTLELEGAPAASGLIKPFIEFEVAAELEADTTTWSTEQRAVILLDHAWDWFLDNLDTNTSQYALLGPLALPVNIDWDRSFSSQGRSGFSRFAKYKPALPNTRNFLYADYVAGKIRLPLWFLSNEARHIRRLPQRQVARILEQYAAVAFADHLEREQFMQRMLIRWRSIEREAGNFMRELWAERRRLGTPPESVEEWLRRKQLVFWARWQAALNALLRGPIGRGARQLLSFFRGQRARLTAGPASAPPPEGGLAKKGAAAKSS